MIRTLLAASALALATPALAQSVAPQAVMAEHKLIRTTMHGSTGPVVVLIPGLSSPGAVWDDTVAALSPTHRLLVVEVKGFDGIANPDAPATGLLDAIVEEVSADLTRRRIGNATIVGHSLGGLLAMKLGLAHPQQAAQLMVVDALPFFGTVFDPKATVASITPRAVQMRDMMLGGAAMMKAAAERNRANPPADCGKGMVLDPKAACRVMMWSLTADPTIVATAMYEDVLTDLRGDIAGLKMPVTVLYQAAIDPAGAKARYTTDYAALKGASLVPVERTSHFIMLDRPDAFRAELAKMLP